MSRSADVDPWRRLAASVNVGLDVFDGTGPAPQLPRDRRIAPSRRRPAAQQVPPVQPTSQGIVVPAHPLPQARPAQPFPTAYAPARPFPPSGAPGQLPPRATPPFTMEQDVRRRYRGPVLVALTAVLVAAVVIVVQLAGRSSVAQAAQTGPVQQPPVPVAGSSASQDAGSTGQDSTPSPAPLPPETSPPRTSPSEPTTSDEQTTSEQTTSGSTTGSDGTSGGTTTPPTTTGGTRPSGEHSPRAAREVAAGWVAAVIGGDRTAMARLTCDQDLDAIRSGRMKDPSQALRGTRLSLSSVILVQDYAVARLQAGTANRAAQVLMTVQDGGWRMCASVTDPADL